MMFDTRNIGSTIVRSIAGTKSEWISLTSSSPERAMLTFSDKAGGDFCFQVYLDREAIAALAEMLAAPFEAPAESIAETVA